MEDIANNLKDPSWWLSVFFMAILASLIAGFLKDKIERWIGGLFSGLRVWRAKREAEREKVIEALVTNDTYLHIALFKVVIGLLLFAISVVLYSTAPVMLSTAPTSKDSVMRLDKAFLIWKILSPVLGVFTVYIGYKGTSRMSIVFTAIGRIRKKHDLPKFR